MKQGYGEEKKMKFCATIAYEVSPNVPVLLGGDMANSIKKAKEFGYDAVELHIKNPKELDVKKITSSCEKYDIEVSGLATGRAYVTDGLSLIDDSEDIRQAAVNRLKEYIDVACVVGGCVILGCIRGNIPDQSLYDMYENRLAESMKKVTDYAEGKNVSLVLEAINRYENNYLNTAMDTFNFIKNNGIPATKILLDTFHMNIEEVDINQSIKDCKELLGYLHVADSNRRYPGAGHVDFKGVIEALKEIDYEGYISAECFPLPDSDTSAQKGLEQLKSLL